MTAEGLRDRLLQQPFKAFGLRMPDERLLPVPHPEFISIDPEEEQIAIVWNGQGGYWTIDLATVSDLEPLDGNFSQRRRR